MTLQMAGRIRLRLNVTRSTGRCADRRNGAAALPKKTAARRVVAWGGGRQVKPRQLA